MVVVNVCGFGFRSGSATLSLLKYAPFPVTVNCIGPSYAPGSPSIESSVDSGVVAGALGDQLGSVFRTMISQASTSETVSATYFVHPSSSSRLESVAVIFSASGYIPGSKFLFGKKNTLLFSGTSVISVVESDWTGIYVPGNCGFSIDSYNLP